MDKTKRFDLKTIMTLIVALMLSLTVMFTAGCNKGDETSTSSSSSNSATEEKETIKDYQIISNGDFEFGTTDVENDKFPVNTGINWSRANDSLTTSAITSDYASGIINTEEEAYNSIAEKQAFPIVSGTGENAVYFNPRTPYYYGLIKDSFVYNKDAENSDKLPTTGSKVLMIHNKLNSENGRGTAQKFTSSKTIDIKPDTYNKVSVWVLTKDLKTLQSTNEFGAYVALQNTVSIAKNPLLIKNINTDGKWAQINFYVEGSSLLTSSYKLCVGLGTGSRKVKEGYVEGFAYFDNVTCDTMTKAEYDNAVSLIASENKYSLFVPDAENVGLYKDANKTELSASLYGATIKDNGEKADAFVEGKEFTKFDYSLSYDLPAVADTSVLDSAKTKLNASVYPYGDANFGASSEIGQDTFSNIASKVSGVTNPLGDGAETIYMIYPKIASHTISTKNYTLKSNESMLLTFYAKVKADNSQHGVTVSVVDNGSTTTPCEKATVIKSSFNTNDYENDETNDWAKFSILVTNNIDDGADRNFSLKIDFGPTDPVTDAFLLPVGYALFTGFETTMLSENQYDIASPSPDYAGNVQLGAELINGAKEEDANNDFYSFTNATSDNYKIETDLSNSIVGYTGVVGSHTMVGGDNTNYSQPQTKAGLFNTKYINTATYESLSQTEKDSLTALKPNGENKYVQALLINNTTATSYGYLGASNKITAKTTSTIAVKVKVFGDAKAFIYLANANALEGFDVLSLSANKWNFDGNEVTYADNEYLVDKKYVQTVVASDTADGYATVYFQITAGINDIDYRVEVWNGSRDGAETSTGMIVIESISTNATLNLSEVKANNGDAEVSTVDYTRAPTLVAYTNDEGVETTKFQEYNASNVWTEYPTAKTIIASHSTIDAEKTLDETTNNDDISESEDDEESKPDTNVLLQVMSLIIAVILIIALIAVGVRAFSKKTRQKEVAISQGYSRNTRDIANRKIAENKKRKAEEMRLAKESESSSSDEVAPEEVADETEETEVTEETTETLPEYDYDNIENNIEKEETEVSETSQEETVEEKIEENSDNNGDNN